MIALGIALALGVFLCIVLQEIVRIQGGGVFEALATLVGGAIWWTVFLSLIAAAVGGVVFFITILVA